MRDAGFRKKARTFRLASDRSVAVLNVQASRWNQGGTGRFTLNLGVHWPETDRLMDRPTVGAEPKEYECVVRARIGDLLPGDLDRWWEIDSETSIEQLGAEVAGVVSRVGLPWLLTLMEPEHSKSELERQGRYWELAAFALAEENAEEARRFLALELGRKSRLHTRVRKWAQRHNLAT
ncbi:MAG: DUF4304 domain-containing protein [Phycisphaerales bacterium]